MFYIVGMFYIIGKYIMLAVLLADPLRFAYRCFIGGLDNALAVYGGKFGLFIEGLGLTIFLIIYLLFSSAAKPYQGFFVAKLKMLNDEDYKKLPEDTKLQAMNNLRRQFFPKG